MEKKVYKPKLVRTIFKTFGFQWGIACFIGVIEDSVEFIKPMILRYLVMLNFEGICFIKPLKRNWYYAYSLRSIYFRCARNKNQSVEDLTAMPKLFSEPWQWPVQYYIFQWADHLHQYSESYDIERAWVGCYALRGCHNKVSPVSAVHPLPL